MRGSRAKGKALGGGRSPKATGSARAKVMGGAKKGKDGTKGIPFKNLKFGGRS